MAPLGWAKRVEAIGLSEAFLLRQRRALEVGSRIAIQVDSSGFKWSASRGKRELAETRTLATGVDGEITSNLGRQRGARGEPSPVVRDGSSGLEVSGPQVFPSLSLRHVCRFICWLPRRIVGREEVHEPGNCEQHGGRLGDDLGGRAAVQAGDEEKRRADETHHPA